MMPFIVFPLAGASEITAAGAATFGSMIGSSATTVSLNATGSAGLGGLTGSGAATLGVNASGDTTFAAMTGTAAGDLGDAEITATGAVTLDGLTGSSETSLGLNASGSATLAAMAGSFTGSLWTQGYGGGQFAELTGASTGTLSIGATGAATLADLTSASEAELGAATLTLTASTISPTSGTNGTEFTSSFTGAGYSSVSRQWYSNGEAVAGQTGATYTATVDDLGLLSCEVTLGDGSSTLTLESGFIPVTLSIPNLLAGASNASWFDPSDWSSLFTDAGVTNVSANGQSIGQWNDKSGIGSRTATQATAGSRPTMVVESDGRRAVLWDGTDDELALSANLTCAGVVIGATPSAADTSNNFPTPLGSSAGPYITIGPSNYRYRSAVSSTTSTSSVANPNAQVGAFNCFAANSAVTGDMNGYQDGAPNEDNPEVKELIDNIDLLGRRGTTVRFASKCYGFVTRSTPFADAERYALQEYMGRKTLPALPAGQELHFGKGFNFTTYTTVP